MHHHCSTKWAVFLESLKTLLESGWDALPGTTQRRIVQRNHANARRKAGPTKWIGLPCAITTFSAGR
jgi:hypothetical protein